jgi:GNAT superfamily N-acetyltransferase
MNQPDVIIREPRPSDDFAAILRESVVDRDSGQPVDNEIDSIQASVAASISGPGKEQYLVAEHDGQVIGMIGMQYPEPRMRQYTETIAPVELKHVFVAKAARGLGIGKLMVAAMLELAIDEGATEAVVNSGVRYEKTGGWLLWNRLFGQAIDRAANFYGEGRDASVWRRVLGPN